MNNREVMQQALEALVQLDGLDTETESVTIDVGDVIAALKAALEQQEQQAEPIGWLDGNDKLADFMHRDLKADHDKRGSATPREFTIPVYTTTPQRPWVGLTEEYLAQIDTEEIYGVVGNHMAIAMAMEAKLKELNK